MSKQELISSLAERTGDSKVKTEAFLNALVAEVTEALRDGKEVSIHGIGTFKPKQVEEHQSRNPRTGEAVTVAAHVKPTFKPSKILKDGIQ